MIGKLFGFDGDRKAELEQWYDELEQQLAIDTLEQKFGVKTVDLDAVIDELYPPSNSEAVTAPAFIEPPDTMFFMQ